MANWARYLALSRVKRDGAVGEEINITLRCILGFIDRNSRLLRLDIRLAEWRLGAYGTVFFLAFSAAILSSMRLVRETPVG